MRFSFRTAILFALLVLWCALHSTQALSRDEIAKKLKQASEASTTKKVEEVNTKAKMDSNKKAQKRKQDVRSAKRQNKKDIRNARKKQKSDEF
jgi:hypothetical protein